MELVLLRGVRVSRKLIKTQGSNASESFEKFNDLLLELNGDLVLSCLCEADILKKSAFRFFADLNPGVYYCVGARNCV